MRINYNFAFKDSKLRPWERPSPPNLLLTDASLEKKLKYIYDGFNNNGNLFYPSTVILASSIGIYFFNLYPKAILKTLESDHYQYEQISNKLSNLEASKARFKSNLKDIEDYFYQPTTSYLFAFYLQNSIPKGIRLDNYYFSDNGFDITATSYSIENLNEFLTLIIESPVVIKESVSVAFLNRVDTSISATKDKVTTFNIAIYGDTKKIDIKNREKLYEEAQANGLLKKLKRFNNLKNLLQL